MLFLLVCTLITAKGDDKDSIIATITRNIEKQLVVYPQEKIYLHNDKTDYISGEKIWFRLYLVDAVTHQPATASRYAYSELIDELDSVICRVKVKSDCNNLHYGYIQLKENLPGGDYRLRAYTRYAGNQGTDYFYTKSIRIFNRDKKKEKKYKNGKTDYDVMFFPEGGSLLEGTICRVGFKAINSSGLHENIEGELIDDKGVVIDTVRTYHDGMGFFNLKSENGKKYYVTCKNKEGESKRFTLPKAETETYSLSTRSVNNYLYVSVMKPFGKIVSDSLILLMHTDGLIQHVSFVDNSDNSLVFDQNNFPSGITQILLLDRNLNTLSERLVFILNDDQAKITLDTDKKNYSVRELVKLKAKVRDNTNLLKGSFSLSVIDGNDFNPDTSSTILTTMLLTSCLKGYIENPGFYFQKNSRQASIALDILMMTQGWRRYNIPETIKGNYSKPGILPEQGQVITGRTTHKGILKSTNLKNDKIMLLIPKVGYIDETKTDTEGRYRFDRFELPDSLEYTVQAITNNGGDNIGLTIDKEVFPEVDPYLFTKSCSLTKEEKESLHLDNYITKATKKYTSENNIQMVNLKGVEVTAKKKGSKSIYATSANNSFDSKYIKGKNILSINDLIYKIPGAHIVNGKVYFRGADLTFSIKGYSAAVIIDDVLMSSENNAPDGMQFNGISIDDINIYDVERVDILKSVRAATLLGSRGAGGAIVITMKKGKDQNIVPPDPELNIKTTTLLGYQMPVEFYSPKYETEEEKNSTDPDLRTTIYWKPDVILSEKGEAKIEFYTADTASTYYMVIEGVTPDGKLIHEVSKINVAN